MKKPNNSRERRNLLTGLAFIAPNFIGFLIFSLIPVGASLVLSFSNWDLISPPEFIGIGNYKELFTADPLFWKVLWNTVRYCLMAIPGMMILALLLALLVNQRLRGRMIYRFIYFLPVVTSSIAVSIVWTWMFNTDFGLINQFLSIFNVPSINWLADERTAMVAIATVGIWSSAGYNMVLFLAGLQAIPRQLYEACEIDGGGTLRKFTSVTIPMLTPTTFFVLVMSIINSFQVFDYVYMMTRGAPNNTTKSIVSYIYDNGFQFFKMGNASALSWVLFLIVFSLTYVQFKMQDKWVEY
ncbi:carbohydrate ABC transporter permease [Ruminiclostridium cellobioparum]|uniref:carbohydrate ABC transporter permease n=1 Tax=Ruminiclostridium cellobioparum TaxID=29355 RepID=UPI0028AEAC54|nr:sugar ABC transporter permease [Ruminiclostridium cellobioparum]